MISALLFLPRLISHRSRLRLSHAAWHVLACLSFCVAWSPSAQAQSQPSWPQAVSSAATSSLSALSQRQLPTVVLSEQTPRVDLLPLTEYWIDENKNTSMIELQARANAGIDAGTELFKPSQGTDAHRIHDKVLWLRFDIKNTLLRQRWLLEHSFPLIDDLQLYWQDPSGRWMVLKAGDKIGRAQWPMPTRLPTFALKEGSADVVRYYLRVENARVPVSLPLVIYSDSAYMKSERNSHMLLGALAGLIALMLAASFAMAYKRREQAFIACSAYLLCLGLFNFAFAGLLQLYVWNESPLASNRMSFVLAALTAALGPYLVRMIVQPVARVRALNVWIAAQAVLMFFCAAVEAFYPTVFSYVIFNLGVLTSVVLVCSVIAAAWQRGEAITRWVTVSFVPVALSALPVVLRNFGVIPNSFLTLSAVHIATAIALPMLIYALLARSHLRRESMARATGLPTKDALTGLPNLSKFLEQMHGSILRAERFKHAYGLIVVELLNHAWFVKEHGREMADRALIITSTRLQQQLRDVDGICRLDETNFAILVEGACQAGQLTKLAASLSASAHAPTEILPVGASLRLSICCALMPTAESLLSGEDASDQLGWLITAAEAIPREQRKMVRSIGF